MNWHKPRFSKELKVIAVCRKYMQFPPFLSTTILVRKYIYCRREIEIVMLGNIQTNENDHKMKATGITFFG
jgi:hypothetical protein